VNQLTALRRRDGQFLPHTEFQVEDETMRRNTTTIVTSFQGAALMLGTLLALMLAMPAHAATRNIEFISTAPIERSTLEVGRGSYGVSGRVSVHFEASDKDLARGQIRVPGFNIVHFEVPQSPLTGVKHPSGNTGVVGFRVKPHQTLKYDPVRGSISGALSGQVDVAQLALTRAGRASKGDVEDVPTQRAELRVDIQLTKPFSTKTLSGKIAQQTGEMLFEMIVFRGDDVNEFAFEAKPISMRFEYVFDSLVEVSRKLCLQPVNINWLELREFNARGFSFSFPVVASSGAGLDFGMPGANTEWAKADVIFDVRPWKSIYEPRFAVLTEEEREELLPLVADDDCIEMYFVDAFDPQELFGGGVTRSSGSASSTITSSDENADFGIDFTHLAHELGHVMALRHPGNGSETDGSTGTLMCPSGFAFDNPAVNSQENEDLLENPLFEYQFVFKGPAPDCADSGDCGECPEIP
jgi:hypothetical protein